MFLTGTGVGIIYAGVLCLIRAMVEFNDIVTNGAALENQAYRVAIGFILEIFRAGIGTVVLGTLLMFLGFGYKALSKKEAASE